jgi:hypothetical protein
MTEPQPDRTPRPDDDGPLLLEDILSAKRILLAVAVITILALLGLILT